MKAWGCRACAASLMGALLAMTVEAAEFKRHDGIHRIEKKAQITDRAVLDLGRRDNDICGTSMKLCPSSFDGGCCPDNYDCAKESCYATTKGPSTCGTLVGWHVCDAVYGAGCCPDGYLCQTAGNCVPPSGSAYTYGCPASHHLCPPSMSYGCCPNGMACAVNQCYSTATSQLTTTMAVTTTEEGVRRTYQTAVVTVITPVIPSTLPTAGSGDGEQAVLKYFPSAIAKITPTSTAAAQKDKGGLSTGMIAGIVGGAVAFLIVILVASFIIIRHLNKVVAVVSTKQSDSSRSRPPMKDFKPTDSEVDALSVDPLMMSPRPTRPRGNSKVSSTYVPISPDNGSNDPTPSGLSEGYQSPAGQSRHTSMDTSRVECDYFDSQTGFTRLSHRTSDSQGAYTHVRNLSYGSDNSDGHTPATNRHLSAVPSELDSTPYIPELPTTPVAAPPFDERRRSSGSNSTSTMARPERIHQRKRSEQRSMSDPAGPPLTVVDEEIHGFHGPYDHFAGQTLYRPNKRSPVNQGGQHYPNEGPEEYRRPS